VATLSIMRKKILRLLYIIILLMTPSAMASLINICIKIIKNHPFL